MKDVNITYSQATDHHLQSIINLQQANLASSISSEELQSEGFVTVVHDLDILKKMNAPHGHIIALDGELLVGYTLVMLRSLANDIPVLIPLFNQINKLQFNNRPLIESRYVVMGQVCIMKKYRSMGIFKGLYAHMAKVLQAEFDYIITEIDLKNPRSIRAHEKAGFQELHRYDASDNKSWSIVIKEI